MTAQAERPIAPMPPAERLGGTLRTIAFLLLLASAAARCVLPELPYRSSALRTAGESPHGGPAPQADRMELARVSFAVLLLAAAGLWMTAGALQGALEVRHGWLALLILAFAILSLLSAAGACDKRAAMDGWIEQVSLLGAGFLAAQLARRRLQFALVVAVLAAVGLVMAGKGLWEVAVDIPDRIADFQAHRSERLMELGIAPDSAQGRIFEARLKATTPLGFSGLSEVFASGLLLSLTAAGGLAADKLRRAWRERQPFRASRARGEIQLPMLAGALTAAGALAVAGVLVLTRSRGGIIAAVVAAIGGAIVYAYRDRLRRHWAKAVLVAAGAAVLLPAATVAYGLKYDRLPSKSMTFRWYYWTGAAQIVRRHPIVGVGPGNFGPAYLAVRRPQAEEAVKLPHNLIAHAAAEYGLAGGAAYLAALCYFLVAMTRARPQGQAEAALPQSPAPAVRREVGLALGVTVLGTMAAPAIFAGGLSSSYSFLLGMLLPAGGLAAALWLAGWTGKALAPVPGVPGAACRIALAAGAAGFVLHNLVGYSLWVPGTATAFYLAAGACLAQAAGRTRQVRALRWHLAIATVAAVAVAAMLLWRPVFARQMLTEQALEDLHQGRTVPAIESARQAAHVDPLDPLSASEAGDLVLRTCPRSPRAQTQACLQQAFGLARQAMLRAPGDAGYYRRAGEIAWYILQDGDYRYAWRASADKELADKLKALLAARPEDPLLLSDLAGLSAAQGQYAQAVQWLQAAVRQDPTPALLTHLGDVLWSDGQAQQAAAAWRQAAHLAPGAADADHALSLMARAVELNPQGARLRLAYARMLCQADSPRQCLEQLDLALRKNDQLLPESLERFTDREQQQARMLRARAQAILPAASSSATQKAKD